MTSRATRKAGIQKPRLLKADNPQQLQRTLDAIIERLEVLDGIRGHALDRAVTYRELQNVSGFGLSGYSGAGVPIIGTTPGPPAGGGIGVGPAAAPSNLVAAETFLAILLTWNNPSQNLQHIEIWRSTVDNLSTASLVGTTVSPQFLDYVGANASFYYWVRAIGTDGSASAYNSTSGTLGTTGVDPSEFEPYLTISTTNLDAALTARIDLIDSPTTGLVDRTAALEGNLVAAQADITTLESSVSGLTTTVGGHTTSINANASSISTNSTSITTLQSDVAAVEAGLATNTAQIAVNANNILTLQASIGAIDSAGGQEWGFDTDLEGFTVANATLTGPTAGAAVFTPTASNPQLTSETIALPGGIHTQVVVRLRQTIGGGTWEGNVYYQTSGHGFTASFYKNIPDPSLSLSEWTVLTWDMSDLTAGADDWVDSTIEAIRLDLVSDNGGKFEIDYILIAKFSTTAISEAIDALDVRVTANESSVSSQGTAITNLESTVNNPTTGVVANASAISGLTTDVTSNTAGVSSNSAAIVALQNTVNDPTDGVLANASAINTLQTDVSTLDGLTTSQAQSITQIVASIDGGTASIVNSLKNLNQVYGTTFLTSEILSQTVGGRSITGGRISTASTANRVIRKGSTAQRMFIEPNAVYEVRCSIYDQRGITNNGSFIVAPFAYNASAAGSLVAADRINGGVVINSLAGPAVLESYNIASHANTWYDVRFYVLGANVSATRCPDMSVNGNLTNSQGFTTFYDGIRVATGGEWVELLFQNSNNSPTYGDDNSTSLWVTDVVMNRIDTTAALHSAISQEATVRATETGELSALYAVKVELATNNEPYISGFGIAADVIDGIASSAFGIRADQFYIASPTYGTNPGAEPGDNANSSFPFIVDLVDGVSTVGINGQLIVDGTIRADSIVAASIGADRMNVNQLSAISANMGTLTSGLIRTATSPALRVELQDSAATAYPFWYGSGTKSAANGRLYVDTSGNVTMKGLLDAGMIKQSYFTPAGTNNTFRIACDYPSNYTNGVYTGKKAHINFLKTTGAAVTEGSAGIQVGPVSKYVGSWQSNKIRVYSPTYTGTEEYGRLGTLSETLFIRYTMSVYNQAGNVGGWLWLAYQYDGDPIRYAYIYHGRFWGANLIINSEDLFITRNTAWTYLDLWTGVGCEATIGYLQSANFTVECPNFGYADLASQSTITDTTGSTTTTGAPVHAPTSIRRYL